VNEEGNPLLRTEALPRFDEIRAEHVEPAMRTLLARQLGALGELEAAIDPTWSGLVEPLERLGDRVAQAWGVVQHLMGVRNSDALREAQEAVQPEVVTFGLRVAQSRPIYDGLCALHEGAGFSEFEQGGLRLTFVDLETGAMMWEGIAQARIHADDPPKVREKRVTEAVRLLLKEFPDR